MDRLFYSCTKTAPILLIPLLLQACSSHHLHVASAKQEPKRQLSESLSTQRAACISLPKASDSTEVPTSPKTAQPAPRTVQAASKPQQQPTKPTAVYQTSRRRQAGTLWNAMMSLLTIFSLPTDAAALCGQPPHSVSTSLQTRMAGVGPRSVRPYAAHHSSVVGTLSSEHGFPEVNVDAELQDREVHDQSTMSTVKNVPITWSVLYVGLDESWLSSKEVVALINEHAAALDCEEALLVDLNIEEEDKDFVLKVLQEKGAEEASQGRDAWQLARMVDIKKSKKSLYEKLEDISWLWADIDYPEEWNDFIYYMPNSNGEVHTSEEIYKKFLDFLEQAERRQGLLE